ncbi:E3 ubiquitin-protein ligase SIAH2-like [Phymastichus coffea]|uniref:E3 ubiquitin-protein ligase SIAH2-like n=1 Tax=Phymastichus coffea TaxID=108790 RepID=UPI00273BC379|nr:E3 ubiquitin-protein ligase SIAH2-like [Phymastichus coffea]
MVTMKIVLNRNRNTRTVITTDFEQRLLFVDNYSQQRSRTATSSVLNERNDSFQECLRRPTNRFIADRKCFSRTVPKPRRYRMKKRLRQDIAIIRTKFARLSVNVSTDNSEDERVKNKMEPSAIQLREPVLRFSRSYEEASSPSVSTTPSISIIKKADPLNESLIRMYSCRMCPNFALPEVHECSSGHLICNECWLLSSHCALCVDKNSDENTRCSDSGTFRRIYGLEKIASLLLFPCRWRDRGCFESFGPRAWRDHVDSCRHTKIQLTSHISASQ